MFRIKTEEELRKESGMLPSPESLHPSLYGQKLPPKCAEGLIIRKDGIIGSTKYAQYHYFRVEHMIDDRSYQFYYPIFFRFIVFEEE
jgi:hypothetical protein